MTKEELLELLQKGITEDVADEIIAAFSDSEDEDSLQALQKALEDNPDKNMDDLVKAAKKGGDEEGDEGDDDDYDEKFMKKYMKRYMKENKKSSEKTAKEAGLFGDKMEKAIDGIDLDSEAAVIEMEDLKPVLETIGEAIDVMSKAIPELAERTGPTGAGR